jgi:hypothetical protein
MLPLPGLDSKSLAVQPVANHFTDCAVPAPLLRLFNVMKLELNYWQMLFAATTNSDEGQSFEKLLTLKMETFQIW